MKVVSIDVGVRNLAIGVFEQIKDKVPFTVHFWKNIDIQGNDSDGCQFQLTRGPRKGQTCGQTTQGTLCYCSTHARKMYPWPRKCRGKTKKDLDCKQKVTWHSQKYHTFACSHHKADDDLLINDKHCKKMTDFSLCSALTERLDQSSS